MLMAGVLLVLAGCSSVPQASAPPVAAPQPAGRLMLEQANDVTVTAINDAPVASGTATLEAAYYEIGRAHV